MQINEERRIEMINKKEQYNPKQLCLAFNNEKEA